MPAAAKQQHTTALPISPEFSLLIQLCMKRIRRWRPPPHWSHEDWLDEARAEAVVVALQALDEFEPERGVPLECFVRARVVGRVKTLYCREWAFGRRWSPEAQDEDITGDCEEPRLSAPDNRALAMAVAQLDDASRRLIVRLFYDSATELEIARELGVTQQAVSYRKAKALQKIHDTLFKKCQVSGKRRL